MVTVKSIVPIPVRVCMMSSIIKMVANEPIQDMISESLECMALLFFASCELACL